MGFSFKENKKKLTYLFFIAYHKKDKIGTSEDINDFPFLVLGFSSSIIASIHFFNQLCCVYFMLFR